MHERIERGFESWGRFVCRQRWATTACVLLATLVLGSWIPRLESDFGRESYLRSGDPVLEVYDRFRDEFDRDDRVVIGLAPPEVFDLDFLERLRALHRDLEREVPYLDEVLSLVNARWTRGEDDELIVEELMEEWPADAAALAALRQRVLSNPLYRNTLISKDATFTTLTLKPLTYSQAGGDDDALGGFDEGPAPGQGPEPEYLSLLEGREMVAAIDAVVERHRGPEFPLHVMGSMVLGERLRRISTRDANVFISCSMAAIGLLLFGLFRRLSGVILPLVVIGMTLVATAGCVAVLGIPFSIVTQLLPTFLIAIAMCDAVHILTIFYRELEREAAIHEAVAGALRHSGLAVVMTSLTTAGALASFAAAEIEPVANLGIAAPFGVLLALVYTLTLLPALLSIVPLRTGGRARATWPAAERFLVRCGELATRRPVLVLALTLAVLLVGLGGLLRARFAHHVVENLPEGHPDRVALELVDRKFEGTAAIEVLIDTGRDGRLLEPEVLHRLEAAPRRAAELARPPLAVGASLSIVDLVKEIHQALNGVAERELPDERALVAQELLLFEQSGSDDLEDLSDLSYRRARLTLRVPWVDGVHYPPYLDRLEQGLRPVLGDIAFDLTGSTALYARTFVGVITSLARSYAIALAVITPLMILLIGSLRRGLLAMLPNLIPVFLTLGFMGWAGISLNFSTLLVGSIVIGVAVDDTIHFMHKFNRYYAASGDVARAVHETLTTTGVAMLVTSIVLAGSFSVFVFGTITGTVHFGMLTAFATVAAFLSDVLVAPALLTLVLRP